MIEEDVPDVNVPVPDPPVHQEEVNNVEAATANANEADDVVMADANVELEPATTPEANEATAPEASEATASEAPIV